MKICVTATASSLDAQIDPRFGRCPYFIVVDSETMKFEAIRNVASSAIGGAGIRAAQTVSSKEVEVLITGNIGPNAFQALSAAGIKVMTGASGIVREAIVKYKRDELKETNTPTVRGHYGMGTGRGRGQRQQ